MGSINFSKPTVEMRNIIKVFGNSFKANDGINLKVHRGEVHALLGENGAGKTTLMNILYGLYQPTSGEILINEKKVVISDPNVAISLGIGMVHQHFMLVKPFTVTENIILGVEPAMPVIGRLNMRKAQEQVKQISEHYKIPVNPDAKIEEISVGMQQRVEILKALYRGVDILILDEPTASLTPQEIKELMAIIENLAQEGKTIILITHKLKEIREAADYCTIIRRGKPMGTVSVAETDESKLASLMVGRDVLFTVQKSEQKQKDDRTVLDVRGLKALDYRDIEIIRGLSLSVKKGEILGIAGVDGNGQSELAEVLTGLRPAKAGTVTLNGTDITNKTPLEIYKCGLGNIPEDRQRRGLVLDFSVSENLILQKYGEPPYSNGMVLNKTAIDANAAELIKKFDIRPPDCAEQPASSLSGGNQQKVIIAREVTNNPELLLAVNPTRGLDVGAIEFVHKYLIEQRDMGKGVLLISFELDEIISLSDRINVIFEGTIVGEVSGKDADENKIGLLMAGGA